MLTRLGYDNTNSVYIFVKLVLFKKFPIDLPVKQFKTCILSYYHEKAHKSFVNMDV